MKDVSDKYLFARMQKRVISPDLYISDLVRNFEMFSSVTTESFYVLDISQKQFCYIKSDDLFLCGYSVEEAIKGGCDFYYKIIYPEDLPLWTDICEAVILYLNKFEERRDEIDYFSCTFRLQRNYSFMLSHLLPHMVYHRIKPVWKDDELRYFICSGKSSTAKDVGNLYIYNKQGVIYEEYNFITRRWMQKKKNFTY